MKLYPLCDCLQYPLDEERNKIYIFYYTDSPSKPYDAFIRKEYNIPKETPLYLCVELWVWNGKEYEKKKEDEFIPKCIEGKKWTYKIMKDFSDKYLRFMIPIHEFDFSYCGHLYTEKNVNYQHDTEIPSTIPYYNLDGESCRWNRAWAIDDEEDYISNKYGKLL